MVLVYLCKFTRKLRCGVEAYTSISSGCWRTTEVKGTAEVLFSHDNSETIACAILLSTMVSRAAASVVTSGY